MTDLTLLSLRELREGLDKKSFSSLELIEACLRRAESLKELNCFIELAADQSRQAAREADARIAQGERGGLLGIPVAIKDVILTQGLRTTAGSKILANFTPPYDATVVQKLKASGAIPFGKTNMDEFAMGSSNENSAYGPVRNPWDTSRVPGGSSGGSAAAVAGRICAAALGSDTGGSIRQPAALCGVVGIKPTYGRVSRYGVVAYASSLDQIGTFGGTVHDCAWIIQTISGHDPLDSTSVEQPVPAYADLKPEKLEGLRIGIPDEYFVKGMSADVERSVRDAIRKLEELGARTVPITLPHTAEALATYYVLAPAEASSNLARYDGVRYGHRAEKAEDLSDLYYRSRSEGFGPEVKRRIMVGTFVLSTGYYDAYYLNAQRVRSLIAKDFSDAFTGRCDVIVCPVTPTTAFTLGEKVDDPMQMYLNDIFTIPVNLAGLPGMSVPCGFDSAGLPIGLQLIGKPWDEATLFKTAAAYEQATEWHKRRPAIVEQKS